MPQAPVSPIRPSPLCPHAPFPHAPFPPAPIAQVYEADESVTNYARRTGEAALVVSFVAELPPLGIATYQVRP